MTAGRPRLLDLFCGAGMAADGYIAAGFEVTGVDIIDQPLYPGRFIHGDALAILAGRLPEGFDAIHASPPCQLHTRAKHLRDAQGGKARHGDLLTPTLALLRERWPETAWIVENVPGAPGMDGAAVLCGSSFGLGVRRHRLFLGSMPLTGLPCRHREQGRPWGVYHVPGDAIPDGGRTARDAEHGRQVMGVSRPIPWASLKEGFPPAYTEWVGEQLLAGMPECWQEPPDDPSMGGDGWT